MSISRVVHTLRAYAPAIYLGLAVVAVGYILLAALMYLLAPSQTVTTQTFRLDFTGADKGYYPNGVKFSSSDIVSTPILLKVFQNNQLGRFTTFPEFSRSVFILEANLQYERLAADYQARLADPKISAVDRERIQREWEGKSAALAKNDFSINYARIGNGNMPEALVRKVLTDVLTAWAAYAINEQHVLNYRLNVLSPSVIAAGVSDDYVVDIQLLRSKIYRVLQSIEELGNVPSSDMARTRSGASLEEIRLRLEEIVRFQLDPMLLRVQGSGLIKDPASTRRFLEAQLAYDRRRLKEQQDFAESVRQTLAVYSNGQTSAAPQTTAQSTTAPRGTPAAGGETVMPQMNEGFIDRLVALTSQATDVVYRQKLADDYGRAAAAVVPLELAVAYDQDIIEMLKSGAGSGTADAATIRNQIVQTQTEVRALVGGVGEIYNTVSRNLNPSTELYTLTAPPVRRNDRARGIASLFVMGVGVLALALPVIVVLCLLHARVREEEEAEGYTHPAEPVRA